MKRKINLPRLRTLPSIFESKQPWPYCGLILNEEGNHPMNSNFKTLLFSAAVSGLLTGTAVYAHAANRAEGAQTANGQQITTETAPANLLYTGMHGDKHMCKGQNSCKGRGGCASSDNGCRGKNSCKGKGGCSTMGPKKMMMMSRMS